MSGLSRWSYWRLVLFSKPKCDRVVYRQVAKTGPRNILELGLGDGSRTANLLALASRHRDTSEIRYTGIDLFDGRARTTPPLRLKDAYCALRSTGVEVRLIPGDVGMGLRVLANGGRKYDLVLADSSVADKLERGVLETVSRLMGDHSVFILQGSDGTTAEILRQGEILSRSPRPDSSKAA